jgi:hypothetical protein
MIMAFGYGEEPPDVITNDLFDSVQLAGYLDCEILVELQDSISIIDNRSTDIHDTSRHGRKPVPHKISTSLKHIARTRQAWSALIKIHGAQSTEAGQAEPIHIESRTRNGTCNIKLDGHKKRRREKRE